MKHFQAALAAAVLTFSIPAVSMGNPISATFSDIKDHWAQSSITEAARLGLMQGIGKDDQGQMLFDPAGTVTRSQAAAVLTRAFALDDGDTRPVAGDYYTDVPEQSWYAQAVALCAMHQIFAGDGTSFYPDRVLSRLELALAIQRCFSVKGISVPMTEMMPAYEDTAALSADHMNAVIMVGNTGIMQGSDGRFRPHDSLSRAELARVITVCKNLIDSQGTTSPQPGQLSLDVKPVKEQGAHMEVDLELPVIKGLTDLDRQNQINRIWEIEAENFKTEVGSTLDDYIKGSEQYGYPVHKYQAYSRIQKGLVSDSFISLYIDYYSYTGGAHGFTDRRAYNIDLSTGQEVSLGDLFQSSYNYAAVINQAIDKQISANPDNYFDSEMGFKGIGVQQPYYIKDGQLIVYFGLYEIAPYAAGIQEFKLPLEIFRDVLKSPQFTP